MEKLILITFAGLCLFPLLGPKAAGAPPEMGPAWIVQYDSASGGFEEPRAIAVDLEGNVLVAGLTSASSQPGSEEWVVVKYDPSGKESWVYRAIRGMPLAIAADVDGDIIVTGHSGGDIVTVKLDREGQELWRETYDGPRHFNDDPAAMALDPAGNVYIAASQNYEDEDVNIEILKYSPDGSLAWATQDAPNPRWARSIACDAVGNVYVLGRSGWGDGLVLLKYNRFGSLEWQEFEEASPPYSGSACLALDPGGNAHVVASGFTYKYDPDGNRLWSALNGGSALAVAIDTAGNVGVASLTDEPPVLVLLEYDASGNLLWKGGFGPLEPSLPTAIALDDAGNLYFAYSSSQGSILLKHSRERPGARMLISPRRDFEDGPRGLVLDSSGNPHVVLRETILATGPDMVTRKYDLEGNGLWESRYDGGGHTSDHARRVAVDSEGNIVVSGWSESAGRGVEYATVKYDRDGGELWAVRYDPPGERASFTELGLDPLGNIVIAGLFSPFPFPDDRFADMVAIKYDPAGNIIWETPLDGSCPFDLHHGGMMDIDRWRNVVVSATAEADGYVTSKLDPGGNPVWTRRYTVSAGSVCFAVGQVIDEEGNIFILGDRGGISHTVKYGPDGSLLWEKYFDGEVVPSIAYPRGIEVDPWGNVFVSSTSHYGPSRSKIHITSYDPEGNRRWTVHPWAEGSDFSWPVGMVLDRNGNLLVAADGFDSAGDSSHDFLSAKYDAGGGLLWYRAYDGPAGRDDIPWAISADAAGNAYVAGVSADAGGNHHFIVVEYSPSGNEIGVRRAEGRGEPDWTGGLAVDGGGNLYMTGSRLDAERLMDYFILKFDAVPLTPSFLRGDSNEDGELDLSDVVKFLNYQFAGNEALNCHDAADVDDDGELALTDAIRSLNYQFTGTAAAPEPPGPFECGPDVNPDEFPPCEYPGENCK